MQKRMLTMLSVILLITFTVGDSLGVLYIAKGDKANAISSFKKALAISEVEATRKKLEELEKK